jgi:AmmeMemoRadiSam system protein B
MEAVENLVRELDEVMLLDSDRFRQARDKIYQEYGRLSVRAPYLAGRAYPEDRAELEGFLAEMMSEENPVPSPAAGQKIRALVAPHIDLGVGQRVYARAYGSLRDLAPKRIVLLGVGHGLQGSLFSLTEKTFRTPLGDVPSDGDWVSALRVAGGSSVSQDDFVHRSEHSLEFQLLFCQHLFTEPFRIVPVLCGSFQELVAKVERPTEHDDIRAFLTALRDLLTDEPDTLVIAGVDFSHIGPKFGHELSAAALMPEARSHDSALLDLLCRGDVKGFWQESRRVEDRYHVCGFSVLACLLELFSGLDGHQLDYEFWNEEPTQSAVSFAAVLLTEKAGQATGGGGGE